MPSPGYIPGPLVIPNTVQVRLMWNLADGSFASNVLHAQKAGVLVDQTMADDLYTNITGAAGFAAYMDLLSSDVSLLRVGIKDLDTANQVEWESSAAASPGTGVGNALPEEVALVVTLRTNLAGRAHRGRVYLGGFIVTTCTAQGKATGALTAAAATFIQNVSDAMDALGLQFGVAHRGHAEYVNARGVTVPAELPGTDPVQAVIVRDNQFDSQRRRK